MILVTGGMGFIGVHVVRSLLDAGEDVVVTWNRSWRVPDFWADELDKRVIAEKVDIVSPYEVTAVAVKHRVNGIIHCTAPPLGRSTPTEDFAVNMVGPMYYSMVNLPSRLCHAAVRGALPDYGPAGTPYAADTGDFASVHDLANVTTMVHQAERLKHRIYNMGNGRAVQMQELAEAVMASAPEARIELQPGENPNGNPSDNYLDLTRIKDEFGYELQYPIIERGIADYIAWLRTHDY